MAPGRKGISSAFPSKQWSTDTFKDFVLDQLSNLPNLTCRKMFGGYGLYHRDRFFGILYKGRLYFKTHSHSREKYLSHGMTSFRPNKSQTLRTYYEVPPDLLEDSDQLIMWAQEASKNSTLSRKHK